MVKESRPRRWRATAFLALSLCAPAASMAESPVSLPAEAPASLFAVELGGADAELFIKGSWEASLSAQAALELDQESGAGLSTIQPFLFSQTPDLFLSFLLFDHYFVEAKVVDEVSQARYAFGYRGDEGDLVQEVRAGNDGISFFELPFISFGEGSYRSFGAAAKFSSEGFEGRAMIRYDQASRSTKRFKGGSELSETVIAAYSFIRGRWFYAPSLPASNLVLYAVSASGSYGGNDGKKYRKLESGEYSYSAATGFISLYRASDTQVVAAYDGSSGSVAIGGTSCVILYDPDDLASPYQQVLCRYSTSADPDEAEAYVRDAASGLKDDGYEVAIDGSGYAELTRSGSEASPLSPSYAQPFYGDTAAAIDWIYTTDLSSDDADESYAPVSSREIVIETTSSVSSMTIDSDYLPGTVEVTRDGVADYAFTVDPATYRVTLASPPGTYEVIAISYLRESSERKNGSLAAGLGGLWSLGEGRSAWAALGLRWSVPGVGYGAYESANPGSLTLTGGERDTEGGFTHRAALAASYSKEETSDRYRIEGMESSGSYGTSFRPEDASSLPAGFYAVESSDSLLEEGFPDLVANFHRDESSQQALKMIATEAGWDAALIKVVSSPSYASFRSFSFFLLTSAATPGSSLSLALDEGISGGAAAVRVEVPLDALSPGAWQRIVVKYGDTRIYLQEKEEGELASIGNLVSAFDPTSDASRIRLEVTGAASGQAVWVDELVLEDSVGREALLFQGELAYTEPTIKLGEGGLPLLQGLDLKADLSAGLHEDSYASGGGSLATTLGPLGLRLKARGSASAGGDSAFSGGHELRLPAQAFPLRLADSFDFDPETGAFGKEEGIELAAGEAISLGLGQQASWSPATAAADGTLEQEWSGSLAAFNGLLSLKASGFNKSRPEEGPDLGGAPYAGAWAESFAYVLPAFEEESTRRKASLALSAQARPGAEFLSASVAIVAEPSLSGGGIRRNDLAAKLSLPLRFGELSLSPYYKRSWSDKRSGSAGSLSGDLDMAFVDIGGLEPLFSPALFLDLASSEAASSFEGAIDRDEIESASFAPETGLVLSRGFGSYWYDLILPASLSCAFRRELSLSGDSLTRAGVWEATARSGAINLFGTQGAYPSTDRFDGDEYQSVIQASLRSVEGESAPRLKIQAQHLVSLLAGASDRLNAENQIYVSTIPSKREWSESLSLEISRRADRHWLLDLYRLVLARSRGPEDGGAPASAEGSSGEGGAEEKAGGKLSLVSAYLEELKKGSPVARNTAGIDIGLSRVVTDEESPPLSWTFEEYYEGKLTLPERLTLKARATLSQARDGEEDILSFGGELSLGLTISF
ncbi:MAG TPA: hypothetical protein P5133_12405 [Spirochaetia bacterium]|nr:hypothetical protein [Spirochaetia bacterium]HRZ65725.1 hypothetical protein [Spirochaetia bacterium]